MRPAAAELLLVPLFFLGDLIFRKKNSSGDLIFAIAWTLVFSYAMFIGVGMVVQDTFLPPEFGGTLFFSLIVATVYGVPFLLNSIYLVRLFMQKKSPA